MRLNYRRFFDFSSSKRRQFESRSCT